MSDRKGASVNDAHEENTALSVTVPFVKWHLDESSTPLCYELSDRNGFGLTEVTAALRVRADQDRAFEIVIGKKFAHQEIIVLWPIVGPKIVDLRLG